MYLFNSTVLVEPTNICNLKCKMCEARCTVEAGENEVEHLEPEKFEIALKKLDGYISNVVFQGDCEPTLNPHLEELVKIARKYTEQVAIVTNGMALTPKRIDALVENGLTWFALSIDDHRPEVYNSIRTYSDFSKVTDNLKYLIKKRNESNRNIYIVTHKIVFPGDQVDTLLDYINYFYIELGVNKVTFAPLVEQGTIDNATWLLTRNELENRMIQKGININLKDFANYPYATIHKYCGTNLFFISHEGNFAPCGLHTRSKKNFGNLFIEELNDIVKKKEFKEYHEYWMYKKYDCNPPEICKGCYLLKSPYFRYCLDDSLESCNSLWNKVNN
ncbi:MAG TPA: hypothetical protein DCW90_06900 [Lachnospiraceae bacterium]|nr:radical SAM protein [uncultured Lachnoclostridium sp.]HAU85225.1 hypothetical protein [Lachnospiraceae bacterium]